MNKNLLYAFIMFALSTASASAQSVLYPHHFDLSEVTLLDGPLKTAMDTNTKLLLEYDVDRLLTPFIRQAGLSSSTDNNSRYYQWEQKHPKFTNWGDNSFNLEGHVGGHYLSAIALAYAANHDEATRQKLKARLDYMIDILNDCQKAFDNNTTGLYGYIGGQPINSDWEQLFAGNTTGFNNHRGWVPFYCEHKVLAGLRDAYIYAGNDTALTMFRKLSDWCVNVVAKLSDTTMQKLLDTEHGGINESLADAYQLFGDAKYLEAARKFSHKTMLNGMQTLNTTFLDNLHANTQVPKYIGFERIAEDDSTVAPTYSKAAENFWTDVAENRTTCIGGNSVSEHFLAAANSNRYIDLLDGPESCNSNNMLKLSEMLADRTHDARYADFYEYTMWNHILSTQDPATGGYVYFTTLRPQGYRIYSQVNQAMWCCVGTGMENHSKYGHFIYTHDGNSVVYVNLFTPSTLDDARFKLTQQTSYPYSTRSTITVDQAGSYTIAIRHPWWTTGDYSLAVNGEKQQLSTTDGKPITKGRSSYVALKRNWQKGDVITVHVPMELRYAECPNYTDYIAFEYGPILLGAATTAQTEAQSQTTGLPYEALQNEYAGEGRMDHAPGSRALSKSLTSAPLLIGNRNEVLSRIQPEDSTRLTFSIDASRTNAPTYSWTKLQLQPFYTLQHQRYMCYWYQQTAENYANSDMAKREAETNRLQQRTIDFVATGEQQSEAGHEYAYSSESTSGSYCNETYRDAKANGYIQYSLFNPNGVKDSLSILCRFTTADKGRNATLTVDGVKIADITIPSSAKGADNNGFYNVEYPIPTELLTDSNGNAKQKFVVRLTASATTLCPGLYYLRLMKGYSYNQYDFVATDWTTGDANRVSASDISYDAAGNTLTVNASGQNNVCLMLNYKDKDYQVSNTQKYLAVKGQNLSIADGASYLWWFNGINHGTQVKPTISKEFKQNNQTYQVVAWDITKSGLSSNFTGSRPNVTQGQTIFGLTSPTGKATISYIGFVTDVDKEVITGIKGITANQPVQGSGNDKLYNLAGQQLSSLQKGICIYHGKKVLNTAE